MSDEKPLHVRVAEALGWKHDPHALPKWVGEREVKAWGWDDEGNHALEVPRYDTDWSATGPLIEKYGFWLRRLDGVVAKWDAFRNDDQPGPAGTGDTPLIAVCNLILALAAAGKLNSLDTVPEQE